MIKTSLPQEKPKAERKPNATCFDNQQDKMKEGKVGKVEDEREEPMTDFGRVTQMMEPFFDLEPIDD